MKKLLALALAAAMAISMVACGSESPAVYKTGMGVIVSPSAQDATAEKAGKVEIDTTMAVATFDAEGKVVSVSFDVAQQSLAVNADGTTGDAAAVSTKTKIEKGADYGMAEYSGIGKEMDRQINAMEDWMVGKTFEEIAAAVTDGYATDADLAAVATIAVSPFVMALEEAWTTAVEVTGVAKTGLGQTTTVNGTAAAADKDGSVRIETNVAGIALDAEGKVVWAKIDVAAITGKFTATGDVQDAAEIDTLTKADKGTDYGMAEYSGIGKEWFEQARGMAEWMTGKTIEEVAAAVTDGYAADADLAAVATIAVGGYVTAFEEAAVNAK